MHGSADIAANLVFDNSFVHALPADLDQRPLPRQVSGACFSRVAPTPVSAPRLIAHSPEVAELVGLSREFCESPAFVQVFSGNRLLPGMEPYAACYGGHQFGSWAGQLGDGRAITLGETVNARGRFELQLKGAGRTAYSRTADGRAVLRSSLREFLLSEAMHHLGVPTTRALSLIATGDQVVRDMLYDGHPRAELGAIVCRVAPSFLRFGNFELFAARKDHALLKRLLDYTLRTHFPELGEPSPHVYAAFFSEVARRTAELMAHWMRVGFVHGVMNTDNMSILGLTIDYGPYAMLDHFDPDFTPNTTDASQRRYRFGYQPRVARWNLFKLGEALFPLIGEISALEAGLETYSDTFERLQRQSLASKLGLRSLAEEGDERAEDPGSDSWLVQELFGLLMAVETDLTLAFRALAEVRLDAKLESEARLAPLATAWYEPAAVAASVKERWTRWLERYAARAQSEGTADAERARRMNAVNPQFVLRNYQAQQAIDAAERGDYSVVHELLEVLRKPYDQQPQFARYAQKRPEWARQRVGCSMLSCSS